MGVASAGDVTPPRPDGKVRPDGPFKSFDPNAPIVRLFATVPDVVKMDLAQAQAVLRKAGFENQPIAVGAAGGQRIVERSDPPAGSRHPLTQRVVVRLYHRAQTQEPAAQRMPSLIGMTCSEAQRALASLRRHLDACEAGAVTGNTPPGRIHTQQPRAGSMLSTDSIVRVLTEPDHVVVPGVTGLAVNDAVARLDQAGLRADTGGAATRWHVVQAQEPAAGRRVPAQSTVRLQSIARYVVPDLTGMSCARAQALVKNAGLGPLQCRVQAYTGTGEAHPRPGVIYSQSPAPRSVLLAVQPVQAIEQPTVIRVPDVVGQPEAAARNLLEQVKLRAQLAGPRASAGRYVAAQAPAAGATLMPGGEVNLTLALSVPPLAGLDCEAARTHGFDNLACEPKFAGAAQPINRVFEQSPAPGTRLAAAQPLRVAIAQPVSVPNVVGQGLAQAQAALNKAQLKGQPDAGDGDRDVVAQRPAAGAQVAPGTAIHLNTQRFERVPAVSGLMLPEARARLKQANFAANADLNDRAEARRVDRQSPAAGERLALGKAVALFTHVEVEVPDVVKQRLPDATALINRHGLRVQPDREDNAAEREVRAQQPAAGAKVAEQSAVALTTMRLVAVPDLAGASCKAANERANSAGVRLQACQVQSLSPLVLGEPVIKSQSLAANARVDEGTALTAQAEAPWWSVPVQFATLLSFGLWLGRRFWPRPVPISPRPPTPPPATPAPPAAVLAWRVAPDAAPQCSLRMEQDDGGAAPGSGPQVKWRVISGEPVTCLRSSERLEGDEHG